MWTLCKKNTGNLLKIENSKMKKFLLGFLIMSAITNVNAQTKKPATSKAPVKKTTSTTVKKPTGSTTAKKPATMQTVQMKNALDSFSYALGVSMAEFYKSQGVKDINMDMVQKALKDVQNNSTRISEEECNMVIMNYMQSMKSEKAAAAKKAGQDFLAENGKKPGVVTLPSGLQYQVIQEGTGPKPKLTDTVTVHYHGTLIDGTIFDSSVQRGQSISFPVNGVIKGWVEALQLMPQGSKWKLFIPSDLGYGDNDAGPVIKAGSTLVFDVELLGIK